MRQTMYANLVLSGGGIRGVAYSGVFMSAEKYNISFNNIAGVSAGSIAGSFAAAGYSAKEIYKLMDECKFGDFKITEVSKRIPAVMRLYNYSRCSKMTPQEVIDRFLQVPTMIDFRDSLIDFDNRGLFSNIVIYSQEGCLFDGDILEEWVYSVLKKRGIETFGDIRVGVKDTINPKGYKMRMTAVDADRKRIVVLPDDLAFYGYDPDKFSIAKAVRMSSSVPFAFKPVELVDQNTKFKRTYHFVDGGVLDNFPSWLVGNTKRLPAVGFRLVGEPKKFLSLDTPLSIYKGLVMSIHDVGLPKEKISLAYASEINCSHVGFLDMDLDDEQKKILVLNGKTSAETLFRKVRRNYAYINQKYYTFPTRRRTPLKGHSAN